MTKIKMQEAQEAEVMRDYRVVTFEEIDATLNFIKHAMNQLGDADDRKAFSGKVMGMLNARELVGEDNKRATALLDVASQYANQVAFRLFVEENLSDSLAHEFRSLVPMKDAVAWAKEYSKAAQEEADKITQQQQAYMDERKQFEIFQAVVMGMSKEEAEQKQAVYEAQKAQAIHNAQTQLG